MLSLTMLITQMKSYVPSFLNKPSCLQLHDDEYLLQIDEDAMEEIDIGGRLSKKIGATWSSGKKDWAIEDSNSKSLSGKQTTMKTLNWTKEFDVNQRLFAMMALTEVEKIDWRWVNPAIDRNKVIIEDWVDSDDEETYVSESQKETAFNSENSETSFENRSPNNQNSVGQESRTKGLGNKWEDQSRRRSQGLALIDSGCFGSFMTGDKDKLSDFKEFKMSSDKKWISTKRQKTKLKRPKLRHGMERLCKSRPKVQKCQSQSQY
ncbi:hypothetical protein Tco_1032763 [Tanacetum coccineum]|uniref:Uncharacterized protein n=1 Tax=Tanacetum coccineum TaxID=301880 RepID=A0ABQ5GF18_9ASTR